MWGIQSFKVGQLRIIAMMFLLLLVKAEGQQVTEDHNVGSQGPPPNIAQIPVELGSIDSVTGNLHLEIPIASSPQRGNMAYTARLVYDSTIWIGWSSGYRLNNFIDTFHGTANLGGWRLINSDVSLIDAFNASTDTTVCDPQFFPDVTSYTVFSGFTWKDAEGTVHAFDNGNGMLTARNNRPTVPNCSPFGDVSSVAGFATDGSGYFLSVTNYSDGVVYDRSGRQVFPVLKDTNGNYFSRDASGNIIDTLGRTPVITTTTANQIFYDVLNAQGGRSRYTVNLATVPVSVPNYNTTLTVIQSIGLPNGRSYTFGYDQGSSGNNWGAITSVTLPTGGQIGYTYTPFPGPPPGGGNSAIRSVSTRTVDGFQWHYSPVFTPGPTGHGDKITMTVTKPSGDQTVYQSTAQVNECGYMNTEKDSYNSTGVLLAQEIIDYVGTCNPAGVTSPPPPPPLSLFTSPSRVTTVIPAPGGTLRKKTEYAYSNAPSGGTPTTISEWNFYSGTAPANPDRKTQIVYSNTVSSYFNKNILDRVLSVTVLDSSQTQISQTSNTYDNYSGNALSATASCQASSASQPSPAAPQHDYQAFCTTNTLRGNLTQTSQWLNATGSSITTATNTYDDTGNIIVTKDALLHPTNLTYSSAFGSAYVTQAQNAAGHITTKNYDFNTGLLLSEKDPNGQVTGLSTSYGYDSMGRLTSTTLPDGGNVVVDFHGDAIPLTVTTTQTATPNPSIATTTTYDGYGRPTKKCVTDPEGDDCVDTGYDTNGRVNSVSNPHRTTAAASDGVTTFSYDGLDRQKSVTEPDQNVVSNSYDVQTSPVMGQVVLVTDETLRQRRTVTDGFGRLVEADEPGGGSAGSTASGGLTISGTLQTKSATSATPGTGSVTFSGNEQSKQVGATSATPGTGTVSLAGSIQCTFDGSTCDTGLISITVNGNSSSSISYPNGDPVGFLAQYLVNGFSGNPYVTATWNNNYSAPVITLTAKTSGSNTNYSLSTLVYSNDPMDFPTPSYTATRSGATLTGGTNANPGTTVYDHGTCTVTVNGTPYSKNFGQGDTPSTIASGLATTITAGSLANGSASGATLSLTAKTSGASTNYSLSASCTYDSPNFTSASFTSGTSGSSFTGGANASPAATDAGTVQMSVGGYSASANYGNGTGQDSTATAVASDLVGQIQAQLPGSNPPFSISASGANISITWGSVGTAGNVAVSTISSSNFPKPSFAACSIAANPQNCSTTLSGGADPVPASINTPYVSRYFYDLQDHLTCIEQHGDASGSGCSPAVMAITDNQPPAADATSPWRIRRFAYDSLGRTRWANDPESGLTSFVYNDDSVMTAATDARGITTNFNPVDSQLDSLHRVTKKTYSNSEPSVTYVYDVSSFNSISSSNQIGQLVHMSNGGNAASTFAYDPVGRLIKETNCLPSNCVETANQVTATYDLAGNLNTLVYPSGRKLVYSYNSSGHFTKVNFDSFNGANVNFPYYNIPPGTGPSNWGYWPTGAMHTGVFGNGVQQTLAVNSRQQVNVITQATTSQTLLSKTYGLYDASSRNNGNILSIADGLNAGRNQSYTYDPLNRIASGLQSDGTFNISFSYDPWGNMKESGTANFQPVFDVKNRIATSPYDAAGNLLNDGLHAYTYDAEGRMKTVDGTAVTYTYNAGGQRVRKDMGATATEFIYFGGAAICEKNPATGAWTDYITAYGARIAKDTSTNATSAQYFHADQVDSTRLVTDNTGAVTWQATYNPFGQELSAQNTDIRFQFAGMEYDSESNLNHTEFRQYASAEGRWLSPDPYSGSMDLNNPQSLNRYVYVLNNPLIMNDPEGLMPGCDSNEDECEYSALMANKKKKKKDDPPPLGPCSSTGQGGLPPCPPKSTKSDGPPNVDPPGFGPPGSQPRGMICGFTNGSFHCDPLGPLKQLITQIVPSVCSGGGFGYVGKELKAKKIGHVEAVALVEWDSKEGGAHGGILGGGFTDPLTHKSVTVGLESMRTWKDGKVHTGAIGLLGGEAHPGTGRFGQLFKGNAIDYGGFTQYTDGQLSVGGYLGAGLGGGGGYATLSWHGCNP